MGIINTTPDSFSDGALLKKASMADFQVDVDKALRLAQDMHTQGAVILDVGGESTRPGAKDVSIAQELDRVIPVIRAICNELDVCVSIDTSRVEVISEALKAGASLVNDIRALGNDAALAEVAMSDAAICLMHMQGTPRSMQQTYEYKEVVAEVAQFLRRRVAACEQAGIARSRVIIDPGFGFGKSLQHNYTLLKNLAEFKKIQLPILVGISRKSMIGQVTSREVGQRLAGSTAANGFALSQGANIIRTHDVAATMDAIKVHSALLAAPAIDL
ncbi:MAG: dihydropteroate synthase [SAR86 cluster bacterium]|uniref:dihydropteroate synthase n=1 Tax=SAR86 cluster bacterium TaxID=2030880 RepID=A0A2A4MFI6_9GAMM|nr:MAG: dihydropteroate synthase [SAR86 cluster bacterium]